MGFFSAFYHNQTDGTGIHSSGGLPARRRLGDVRHRPPVEINLQADTGWAPFEVNRAIIQKGLQQQVVYYWFEQRGQRITNDFMAKLVTVWDSLRTGRSDGALVRFTTPVMPGESVDQADARIQRLMAETLPMLPKFLPE